MLGLPDELECPPRCPSPLTPPSTTTYRPSLYFGQTQPVICSALRMLGLLATACLHQDSARHQLVMAPPLLATCLSQIPASRRPHFTLFTVAKFPGVRCTVYSVKHLPPPPPMVRAGRQGVKGGGGWRGRRWSCLTLTLLPTRWPTNPKFAKLWSLSGLVFLSGIYNFAHIHWLLTSHPRLFLLILLISEGNAIGGQ